MLIFLFGCLLAQGGDVLAGAKVFVEGDYVPGGGCSTTVESLPIPSIEKVTFRVHCMKSENTVYDLKCEVADFKESVQRTIPKGDIANELAEARTDRPSNTYTSFGRRVSNGIRVERIEVTLTEK